MMTKCSLLCEPFLFSILYSNCWSIFSLRLDLIPEKNRLILIGIVQVWTVSFAEVDESYYSSQIVHSDNALPSPDSQTPHCLLHLIRCRDIEHILRGPVISVFSPPFNISSFMSPWLLLCESFRSGSEHVVVFSLLMLKALAAWGEISHGRLPAEWFESSKQSLRPNVKNFGNEELPWAALCPKITERACVNLSVFFLLPFFLLLLFLL